MRNGEEADNSGHVVGSAWKVSVARVPGRCGPLAAQLAMAAPKRRRTSKRHPLTMACLQGPAFMVVLRLRICDLGLCVREWFVYVNETRRVLGFSVLGSLIGRHEPDDPDVAIGVIWVFRYLRHDRHRVATDVDREILVGDIPQVYVPYLGIDGNYLLGDLIELHLARGEGDDCPPQDDLAWCGQARWANGRRGCRSSIGICLYLGFGFGLFCLLAFRVCSFLCVIRALLCEFGLLLSC